MNKNEVTISELINLLRTTKPYIKNEQNTVLMVNSSTSTKNKSKGKKKKKALKPKGRAGKKEVKAKELCFHCNKL